MAYDHGKLVLIDGHALAYRMFFALPLEAFTTKSGEPTNANTWFHPHPARPDSGPEPPEYLAVSFDTGATFRDEMFAAYKGTREKMPDELSADRAHQGSRPRAQYPILELESYEADDVLGTVAAQMRDQVLVHIITGDRDLLQLVDDNTACRTAGAAPARVVKSTTRRGDGLSGRAARSSWIARRSWVTSATIFPA